MSDELISHGLDIDIQMTHERFVSAMTTRLPSMSVEMKEGYFGVLSMLVGKLETPDMPLRKILEEMMTEAGALILQQLHSNS